jgi:large subunit ribosomal protein L5
MARLQDRYTTEIRAALGKELGRTNPHALPQLKKIVVSMGLGKAIGERKRLEEAVGHLAQITGQRPQITKARVAVSGFRLREGMEIGCVVTLRGKRMYEFLDRLINLALPRVRDFRGLNPKGFDGRGNYNMGLNEQLVFPEINPDKVNFTQGMNITMVTTAASDDEGRMLLREFGLPFRKDDAAAK